MLGIGTPARGSRIRAVAEARGCSKLSLVQERTLFANWAVVSSPLILSIDARNDTEVWRYWPIVANPRAIKINQAWHGEAGRLLLAADTHFTQTVPVGAACEHQEIRDFPDWLVYSKRLGQDSAAVLVVNVGNKPVRLSISSHDLERATRITPAGNQPTVRGTASLTGVDVWTGATLEGCVDSEHPWTVQLDANDSRFAMFNVTTSDGPR